MATPDYTTLPAPFRLRVLRAITDTLKGITPANGYIHDMSDFIGSDGQVRERVFRGRSVFSSQSDPLPMLSVLEDTRQIDPVEPTGWHTNRFSEAEWKLAVMGFIGDDMDHPTDGAHFFAGDTVRCLIAAAGNIYNIFASGAGPNTVTKMHVGQAIVRPAEAGISDTAFFFVPLKLVTVESGDPFA